MTILTKHTIAIKKTPIIPEITEPERDTDSPDWSAMPGSGLPDWMLRGHKTCIGFFTILIVLVVGMTGFITGVLLYQQYTSAPTIHRFQGFCTVPIGHRKMEATEVPRFRGMPFRFSLSFADDFRDDIDFAEAIAGRGPEDDVQVLSTMDELTSDEYVNSLREELDIGDSVEKISVIDDGHRIYFIHDFTANTSGIVDSASGRCFTMELDGAVSLPPAVFALGMARGGRGQFDVSRVRSTLRAVLPALRDFSTLSKELRDTCQDKPVYQLRKEDAAAVVIRKRSVDEPPHDYIQFAGKHVQEIEINNLAEILEYEQNNTIHNKNSTA